jgi:hypothetical protein
LKLLGRYFRAGVEGCAGDVPAGARETGDEALADRISSRCEDDWDRSGCVLGRLDGRRSESDDNIDLDLDQFGRSLLESLGIASAKSALDREIPPLNPTEVAQARKASSATEGASKVRYPIRAVFAASSACAARDQAAAAPPINAMKSRRLMGTPHG